MLKNEICQTQFLDATTGRIDKVIDKVGTKWGVTFSGLIFMWIVFRGFHEF